MDVFAELSRLGSLIRQIQGGGEIPHLVGDATTGLGVVFQSGWINYDNGLTTPTPGQRNAGFYRFAGRVYLEGIVKSGTVGAAAAFTLPAGYRPEVQRLLPCVSNGVPGVIAVQADGTVWCFQGNNAYFDLDVNFRYLR